MPPIRWRLDRLSSHRVDVVGFVIVSGRTAWTCKRGVLLPIPDRVRRMIQHSIREDLREALLSP